MNTTQTPPRTTQPRADRPTPADPQKKTALIVAGVIVVFVVAVGLAWTILRGPDADTDPVGEAPSAFAPGDGGTSGAVATGLAAYDLDGDGFVYQGGMHPEVIQDEPGQCPICGMDLTRVPVSGAAPGTVEIDPVTLQNIGVRTAPVALRTLERTLRTTGAFEPVDSARVAVSLKIGGWIEDLYVNTEGQRVRRGQPLLALYSPDLVSTQEEYLLALRNRDLLGRGPDSDRLVEAARRRLELYDVSAEQIERLAATGEVTRTLTLYAPAGGTVVEKRVVEGMQVQPGLTLMEIVDLSLLWLQADVPEQDLGWVDVGTRAVVRLESQPGAELRGRVDYVYDTLDQITRTGTARVTVPNPGGRLKPGMYATATLLGAPSEARPTVPSEAVVRTGEAAVVLLAEGEGRFRPKPVRLGQEADGFVQVLDGLSGGERVVTSAQFLIDSEARLSGAIASMTSGDASREEAHSHTDEGMRGGPAETAAATMQSGVQVVRIAVEPTGFEPGRIRLEQGIPARLIFTRRTDDTCATAVAIPALGVATTPLPLNVPVAIEVTPREDGTFTYACSMDRVKGALLVSS